MRKNKLGRTGLEVTQLGYGAMELHFGKDGKLKIDDEKAERILNAALDAGINFVDTSVCYGPSEERIGRYISSRRNEYALCTKCGCDPVDKGGKGKHLFTRDQLMGNIEGSLKRMKTDHVDILQLHNPTAEDNAPMDELVEILREFKSQGLTRFIGISTDLPWLPEYLEMGVFDVFQIPYSALNRQHENVIGETAQADAGIIIRGGVSKGEPQSALASNERWAVWEKANLDELRSEGESRTALMLRFTISHPHTHTIIVGTKRPDHLAENVNAVEVGPLPPEVYSEAKRRLDAAGESPEEAE